MFDQVQERYGRLDFFVSNASASNFHHFMDLKPHHLERTFNLNVRAFVVGTQRAVRLMPDGGRVVVLSSYGSIRTFPTLRQPRARPRPRSRRGRATWRSSSRRSASTSTRSTAGSSRPIPRATSTPTGRVPSLDTVLPKIPKKRMGTAAEVAECVLFLLSPGAEYVTGTTLLVDGGLTAIAPPFHVGHRRRGRRRDAGRPVFGAALEPVFESVLAAGGDRPALAAAPDRDGLDAPRARGARRRRGALWPRSTASGPWRSGADRHRRVGGQPRRRRRAQLQLHQRGRLRRRLARVARGGSRRRRLGAAPAVPRRAVRVRGVVRADPGGAVAGVLALQPVRAARAVRRRGAGDDLRFCTGRPAGARARVRRRRDHGLRGVPDRPVPGAGDEPARRRMGRGL